MQSNEDDDLPDPAETLALVQSAQAGNDTAMAKLLERYQPRLHRIVEYHLGRNLRGQVEPMDVVQSTNEVLFQRIKDIDPYDATSFQRWATRIAINQIRAAHDYHTANKRDMRRNVPLDDGGNPNQSTPSLELESEQTNIPTRAAKQELRTMLEAAMTGLKEDQRRVVTLRDYSGWSWEDIATELGRSVAAAKQLHQRAWSSLREALMPRLKDDEEAEGA